MRRQRPNRSQTSPGKRPRIRKSIYYPNELEMHKNDSESLKRISSEKTLEKTQSAKSLTLIDEEIFSIAHEIITFRRNIDAPTSKDDFDIKGNENQDLYSSLRFTDNVNLLNPEYADLCYIGKFACIRIPRPSHFKAPYLWELYKNDLKVLCAKSHGFQGNDIFIGTNSGVHIKSKTYLYQQLYDTKKRLFIMNKHSRECMKINFEEYKKNSVIKIEFDFGNFFATIPPKSNTQDNKIKLESHLQRIFIISDENGNAVVICRRTLKDAIEFNVERPFPLFGIFGIGCACLMFCE